MTTVVDATVVVAYLLADGPTGAWAEELSAREDLFAPHHLAAEVASALRRMARLGELSPEVATLAHHDLADLRVQLVPYEPFAERIWELRDNVTPYDAWYVATAEALDVPLATLDARLVQAAGPRCRFTTPSG